MQPSIDLSTETSLGWAEWGIVIAIVLIAGIYLWRKLFVKKGCACASCGKEKTCDIKNKSQVEEQPIMLPKSTGQTK